MDGIGFSYVNLDLTYTEGYIALRPTACSKIGGLAQSVDSPLTQHIQTMDDSVCSSTICTWFCSEHDVVRRCRGFVTAKTV